MIILKNISKVYQVGTETLFALNNVNLHIFPQEFVSIIGPSGSGKSTLLNIIGCLDVATDGQYYLERLRIDQYSQDQLADIRNNKIGFIFQNFNLLPTLSAEENVELPLIYQGLPRSVRKERALSALKRMGLQNRANHKPYELSGGQQQRIAIARALVTRPSIILADEPTGNLDSYNSRLIMKIIQELHEEGNTILLITHDIGIARQAPRCIQLFDGQLVEE